MVLTYEPAGTDLMVNYFSHRFKPLQPLNMFGRWAEGGAQCRPSHAVWYAWKDRAFSQFVIVWETVLLALLFVFLYSGTLFDAYVFSLILAGKESTCIINLARWTDQRMQVFTRIYPFV